MSDKKTTKPVVKAPETPAKATETPKTETVSSEPGAPQKAPETPVEAVKEPETVNVSEKKPEATAAPVETPVAPAPAKAPEPSISAEEKRKLEMEILGSTGVVSSDDGVILEHGAERKSVKEMIMDYFRPTDLVKIHNPFKWHTGWAYSHPDEEVVEQDGSATRRVYPGRPKTRVLPAGQFIVIPGWEAYIGVTRFYKQWCQTEQPAKLGVAINSPLEFAKFMKLVYDGVYDPNDGQNNPIEMDARAALERDLGLV